MNRRRLIQMLSAAATLPLSRGRVAAQATALAPAQAAALRALAYVVLPASLGRERVEQVAGRFLAWLRDYKAGAEHDHGYGFTRLRKAPASPAGRYAQQLVALGRGFASLPPEAQRTTVEKALAKVERLPQRPDGGHVASDLMAFFFRGSEANDLCYRAAIGRDACRGLAGSEAPPAPLREGD